MAGYFGQVLEALFKFPLDHIVPCELHACMRVTDRLENAIIKVCLCIIPVFFGQQVMQLVLFLIVLGNSLLRQCRGERAAHGRVLCSCP